jgi:argininosuccinate lyase
MHSVAMLGATQIISPRDASAIVSELGKLHDDFQAGTWRLDPAYDDVHMNVEKALIDRIGMDVAGKMHTTRSRNDQVALDARMMARSQLLRLRSNVVDAAEALLDRAAHHTHDVMIGYTHVQHAQPISVAYWLQAYAASFVRSLERLEHAHGVLNLNPLGAGAIAGTSFPIDRHLTTELLGFDGVLENGLDATGARDYLLDVRSRGSPAALPSCTIPCSVRLSCEWLHRVDCQVLSANSTLGLEMSRLADEFIMWSSYEFRTLTLDVRRTSTHLDASARQSHASGPARLLNVASRREDAERLR